jgi:hypothetical protein
MIDELHQNALLSIFSTIRPTLTGCPQCKGSAVLVQVCAIRRMVVIGHNA